VKRIKKKYFAFLLLLFLPHLYISFSGGNIPFENFLHPEHEEVLDYRLPADYTELAYRITESMTDEQALAQTFMLGWVGVEPSPLILRWIRERNIGGVKVFGWNTDDTLRLAQTIGEFQRNALESGFGIPLFVATDQEGGIVRHVKGNTSETPGNMAIGASGRPMDAYWAGFYIGRELSLLGINMNFAPAVDLFNNRYSSLIGSRSFGSDPLMAGILGAAFARGQRDMGIISTAKHFPGHGDTALDSHGVLPGIPVSIDTLWERELIPYRFLINEGIPAIMSGHLAFPLTPGGASPASLSPYYLTEILREQMGFQGLIVTDDLMMGGALNYTRSLSLAVKRAIEAGNDIIMLSQTPGLNDAVWTFLLDSMRSDSDFCERVRESCRRILAVKFEYLGMENAVPLIPDLSLLDTALPDSEGSEFFRELAARSVTIMGNEEIFPLSPQNAGRVLLAGNYSEFFNTGRRAFPNANTYWYPSSQTLGDLAIHARNADTLILLVSGRLGNRGIEQLRSINARIIVFSILNPGFLDELAWTDAAIAVYSFSPDSFNAGFSAILGRIPGEGSLPFRLTENMSF